MIPTLQLGQFGRGFSAAGAPIVPEATTLLAALKCWWSLNENAASPTYADSHGSHHLTVRTGGSTTNTSSVTTATAKHGQGFLANVTDDRCAYIPRSDTGLDLPNADFSFGGWFRPGQAPSTTSFIMGRVGSSGSNIQAYLRLDASANLAAGASSDGSAVTATPSIANTIWSSSEYQLIVLTLNRTANQLEIRLRRPGHSSGALEKQTVAFAGALYTTSSSANFTIAEGLSSDSTFFSSNRCGVSYADECFFVDKAITDAEMDYLYNSGSGRTYAQLVADAA